MSEPVRSALPAPSTPPPVPLQRTPSPAEVLRPELVSLSAEVVEAIRVHVPELGRAMQGDIGGRAEQDVRQILGEFIERCAAGRPGVSGYVDAVHTSFVTHAFQVGCSLSTVQAVYRISALVVWKRFAAVGSSKGIPPERLYGIAEFLFAYLEKISAESADVFGRFAADPASVLLERRQRLMRLLMTEGAADSRAVKELSQEANWRIPEKVACVAVEAGRGEGLRLPLALDGDVLADLDHPSPHLLVPDPGLPGRDRMLRRAFDGVVHAVGPAVDLQDTGLSLRLAQRAIGLVHTGMLTHDSGHVRCEDHLALLHLTGDEGAMRILTSKALAVFSDVSRERRTRLLETLLAWLGSGDSLPGVAERLRVHPQTVRYRMRQIEALFGPRIHEPEWRFEMQLALRFWDLSRQLSSHDLDP